MLLVVGGLAAGKREYVKSLGYTEADFTRRPAEDKPVLLDAQDLAFADPAGAKELLPLLLQKEVVVCCEVGSGVIPADRRTREGREAAGRLSVLLAKDADRVVRVVCGIPTVIKG